MKPEGEVLHSHEWMVCDIERHDVAARLVRAWHYSRGSSNTSTYRHGLFPADLPFGDPYGVAMWIPPTRAAGENLAGDGWQGVLSLSRLVIDPDLPTNAASFLLGRSMRLIDRGRWPVLVTYADTRLGHTGAIYRATNWTCDGPVPAGDVWLDGDGLQRGRKRGGRTLSAAQMRTLGFERADAHPKIRFVHRSAA